MLIRRADMYSYYTFVETLILMKKFDVFSALIKEIVAVSDFICGTFR